MSEAIKSVRVRIEGRVQGVGFRIWVERTAVQLGLRGWVRNRRDGGVEAVFAGTADAVDAMVQRCHHGPSGAVVGLVKVLDGPSDVPQAFEILPTA
ncbi:MAG TPA: acylphosphatase [Hyphomicrobiaceae bacterium]|jgi:acylphosphatase|nr:acylphosphatase [Hyphomicrobiaceae bacterium]